MNRLAQPNHFGVTLETLEVITQTNHCRPRRFTVKCLDTLTLLIYIGNEFYEILHVNHFALNTKRQFLSLY